MSDYQSGDRVAVYTLAGRLTATVVAVSPAGYLLVLPDVKVDSSLFAGHCHPKWCNRLVKRPALARRTGGKK